MATAIRAGDRASSRAARPRPPRHSRPAARWPLLREAVEAGSTVVIGYVDNHGASSERMVGPAAASRVATSRPTTTGRRLRSLRRAPHHRVRRVDHPAPDARRSRRSLGRWTSSGTPTPRPRSSTPTSPTPTRGARSSPTARGCTTSASTGDALDLRGFQASCGRSSRPPRRRRARWSSQLNDLLAKHPVTPLIADHDPGNLAHARGRPGRLRRRAAVGRVADGPGHLVCDLGATRLGVCDAPGATTSSSTPHPTSRAATAPTGAPRAPTSRPSARDAAELRRTGEACRAAASAP